MTYKIGTRVKKIGGESLGTTGMVTVAPWVECGILHVMRVRVDAPLETFGGSWIPGGQEGTTFVDHWTPIVPDGHRPAEQGSFEPLDHLLSRLKGVEA